MHIILNFTTMKKIIFLLATVFVFSACEKNNLPDKGRLDPNAKILLRGVDAQHNVTTKAHVYGLTPLEVVQQAINIKWTSHWFDNYYYETPKKIGRTFSESDRDFETPALRMWGTDIIAQNGEFYKDFIYGFDVYITGTNNDTIACVPDSVINNARPLSGFFYATNCRPYFSQNWRKIGAATLKDLNFNLYF